MALTSDNSKTQHTATSLQTVFSYGFKIFAEAHLNVFVNGVEVTTGFSVSGVGADAGGNVTFTVGRTTGDIVTLARDVPYTQDLVYPAGNKFPETTHEKGLDLGVMLDQQIKETLDRTMTAPIEVTSSFSGAIPNPETTTNQGKALIINASGTGIDVQEVSATDFANPITTEGDLVVGGSSGAAQRLAIGTDKDVLVVDTALGGKNKWVTGLQARGDLWYFGASGPTNLTVGGTDEVLVGGTDPSWGVPGWAGSKNLLINSRFRIWQRQTSYTGATAFNNNDDTYTADQWVLLSDGNDIVDVSQDTDSSYKFLVATGSKKFGIFQPLPNKDLLDVEGSTVSLSINAKSDGNLANLRAAVLSWDGTADSITSDVVSAWAVSGTNPTLATNWTAENVATNLALTSSYQTFTIEGIGIDTSGVKNIGVFIWLDDTDALATETLNIKWVQLEYGSQATSFERVPYTIDEQNCLHYWYQSYDSGTVPGTSTQAGMLSSLAASSVHRIQAQLPVPMRIPPDVVVYSTTGASGAWRNITTGDPDDTTNLSEQVSERAITFINGSATDTQVYGLQFTADARL